MQEQVDQPGEAEAGPGDNDEADNFHSIWNNKSACQKQYCECYKFNTVSLMTAPGSQRNKEAVSFPQMFLSFQAEG